MADHRGSAYSIDECILSLELYVSMRDSRSPISETSPQICELSQFLTAHATPRSPKSVRDKLLNFKYHDTGGSRGLEKGGKNTEYVWKELGDDLAGLRIEAEATRSRMILSDDSMYEECSGELSLEDGAIYEVVTRNGPEGFERERIVHARANQDLFRTRVLENYHGSCCITGMGGSSIVQACHIKPWSECTRSQRTDVSNGLCLNPLHHLAFDHGYITLSEDNKVVLCSTIEEILTKEAFDTAFRPYEGRRIVQGDVPPGDKFLRYHREKIFLD